MPPEPSEPPPSEFHPLRAMRALAGIAFLIVAVSGFTSWICDVDKQPDAAKHLTYFFQWMGGMMGMGLVDIAYMVNDIRDRD